MTPERFAKIRRALSRRQPDLTVLAENTHKSHNIAAILRTADAVGLHEMHAVSETGELRRHHRVSGGSRKWLPVVLHESTSAAIAALREDGFRLLAAHPDTDARDYRKVDYTRKTALILGSELNGISDTARAAVDEFVAVPMEGLGQSLNVSVAVAIILYEARRQREAAGMYESSRLPEEQFQRELFEWAHPEMALRCNERGLPYPAMNEDGDLVENPFDSKDSTACGPESNRQGD